MQEGSSESFVVGTHPEQRECCRVVKQLQHRRSFHHTARRAHIPRASWCGVRLVRLERRICSSRPGLLLAHDLRNIVHHLCHSLKHVTAQRFRHNQVAIVREEPETTARRVNVQLQIRALQYAHYRSEFMTDCGGVLLSRTAVALV